MSLPPRILIDLLRSILMYDPKTGAFTWANGDVAGTIDHGYIRIRIKRKNYYAHRLAWLFTYGYWPKRIDHINRDTMDNRIDNLREATQSQNMANACKPRHNSSGVKGVHWHKGIGKWRVQVKKDGKCRSIGCFASLEEAKGAYAKAAQYTFGEFARYE